MCSYVCLQNGNKSVFDLTFWMESKSSRTKTAVRRKKRGTFEGLNEQKRGAGGGEIDSIIRDLRSITLL